MEQRHDIASKSLIIDFLISFQVPTLVPMIQITGSNRAPVVAHNHLGVDKAWLEFVDSNTMAQQALVITPTGITNTGVIQIGRASCRESGERTVAGGTARSRE